MSQRRILVVTFGIALGLLLAAMEATVVGTAMPTIVSQLGGLSRYSWVFSIYMLTSTTSLPIYGKLSDMYGRKPIYMVSVALFLGGSALCGVAQTMTQLILARAIQGLGAGALGLMAFTISGDIFTLEQRAKVQGVFSGVWGVSSIIGPLIGGWIVDHTSWRWVFYINLPFGLLAALILWLALEERVTARSNHQIDYAGAALLSAGSICLLFPLLEGSNYGWGSPLIVGLLLLAVGLLAAFVWVEQRVPEPVLPLSLFEDRLILAASLQGVLAGLAVFGTISFLPLFMQGVLGTTATEAGTALAPMLLGWVSASTIAGPLLLRIGYRPIVQVGAVLMVLGAFLITRLDAHTPQMAVYVSTAVLGSGMGCTVVSYLIAVQNSVERTRLGVATSALQFSRQMGGALGTSLMGAILTLSLAASAGADFDPQQLLGREGMALSAEALAAGREFLAQGLHAAFWLALGATVLALVIAVGTPARELVRTRRPSEEFVGVE
jgi:EmrB/QacA subfamily drug resistance transporter